MTTNPLEVCRVFQGDALHTGLPDKSVDLIVESPPYVDARLYLENGKDLGIARKPEAWIKWMLAVLDEGMRVSRGPVIVIAAGKTKARCYQPACEALMTDWWRRGGECHLYRPITWHRTGITGSGGDDWFRADTEYCMCFKRPGKLPWADNTACGNAPKYGPGGAFSHRTDTGERVGSQRRRNGKRERQEYVPPDIANPGNYIRTTGGHLGHPLAHDSDAPFPLELPEFFIKSLCPPDGVVLDRFCGSGSTLHAAWLNGRKAIGIDLRQSQVDLTLRRLKNPHAGYNRAKAPPASQRKLFAEV